MAAVVKRSAGGIFPIGFATQDRNVQTDTVAHSYTIVADDLGRMIEKAGAGSTFTLNFPAQGGTIPGGFWCYLTIVNASATITISTPASVEVFHRQHGVAAGTLSASSTLVLNGGAAPGLYQLYHIFKRVNGTTDRWLFTHLTG